ncbi:MULTISPECIES: phosphoribosylglycinamide formyltransferase [unclassified Roseitalea]|uniref:phosphoribosylglycinamide formyltransferase n=1 Tax=unclassified Roseitalea TaxID=2639107 RepID=UPI00273D98E6|nr:MULTISPECIES: phosphoribosylglycinamide formyltransferase [unclassified Roseitalea]
MSETVRKRDVAVLISGRGSNMIALADACAAADFPARIVGVLSDRADAPGLDAARARGLAAAALPRTDFAGKAAHEAAIEAQLVGWGAEIVCLAGFMRLLSAGFVDRWRGRIINIHPSLLPRHRGLDTHARALAAGDARHGCSVHHVTAGMDEGPVIAQAAIDVGKGDTPETLAARVLAQEHRLYPRALRMLIEAERQQGER